MYKDHLTNIQNPLVQRYTANTVGRDFVVGDIHGAFTLLLLAMERVGFNAETDRLFSVGDLIDRGPESARVARFLAQPYVHAVRGNHEDMLIQLHTDGTFPEITDKHWMVVNNGLGWWVDTPLDQKHEILNALRKLPMVIEVDTLRGTVGILHAEVQSGLNWQEFIEQIEAGDHHVTETALWGRSRAKHNDTIGVEGIGRVFVGHTPQWNGATRLGNVYLIDSGAVFAELGQKDEAKLTMMNLLHKTAILSTPGKLLNILDEPVDCPFGQYAIT